MSTLGHLILALGVTIDELVFHEGERGPEDDLRLQFDAVSQFAPEENKAAKDIRDVLITNTKPAAGSQPCVSTMPRSRDREAG